MFFFQIFKYKLNIYNIIYFNIKFNILKINEFSKFKFNVVIYLLLLIIFYY